MPTVCIHRPLLRIAGSRQDLVSQELQPLGKGKAIRPLGLGPDRRSTPRYGLLYAFRCQRAHTIQADIRSCRDTLRDLAKRPLRQEKEGELDAIRRRDDEHQAKILLEYDWFSGPIPEPQPTYGQVAREYSKKELQIIDPTTLIVIDEADRLRMASLEQVRAIFDAGEIGVILIGMPGLEKKLARYPQFYSRIGFVHEFRALDAVAIRELLQGGWMPPGVHLPPQPWDQETVAAIIRISGGNFRLLNRLLTQVERILEINSLQEVTKAVVEAARESLVIGQA
jgi:hypothetical protein